METIQLTSAVVGGLVRIQKLDTNSVMIERLRSMGLGKDRVIKVLKTGGKQPALVSLQGSDTKIALAPEIADKVWVNPNFSQTEIL